MPKTKVLEVIDGDTFRGQKKTFVRLSGVDAPEKGTLGNATATHKLEELVLGKTISYTEESRSYGRVVGEVKVGSKSVNKAMNNFLKRQT